MACRNLVRKSTDPDALVNIDYGIDGKLRNGRVVAYRCYVHIQGEPERASRWFPTRDEAEEKMASLLKLLEKHGAVDIVQPLHDVNEEPNGD